MSTEKTYHTVEEVAEYWRVSRMTVLRIIERGELLAIKIGGQYRISTQALEQYLKRNTYNGKESAQ
jgi:excisionase family DNA binding protein